MSEQEIKGLLYSPDELTIIQAALQTCIPYNLEQSQLFDQIYVKIYKSQIAHANGSLNKSTFNINDAKTWSKSEQATYENGRQVGVKHSVPVVDKTIEELAAEYAEKYAFQVPYDGGNKFYDDKLLKGATDGFIAGAKHTAATSGMVKKDEVVRLVKERINSHKDNWQSSQSQTKINELNNLLTQLEKL